MFVRRSTPPSVVAASTPGFVASSISSTWADTCDRALERRAVGQANGDEEHALVLVRQESAGDAGEQATGSR